MDVFVIPVASDRYELYCEPAPAVDADGESVPRSWPGRVRQRLASMLSNAEQQQYHLRDVPTASKGWFGRNQDRMLAWVAERIAEQRLLWNLRGQTAVRAIHPEDMTAEQVLTLIQRKLQRDYDRHRRWMIVDGIAFVVTFVFLGPLFLLVPGVANLPAGYFGFRVVGHWFSTAGAKQGLRHITWTNSPSTSLTELRDVAEMEPADREQRVHDVAMRLQLQHLSTFFERLAV